MRNVSQPNLRNFFQNSDVLEVTLPVGRVGYLVLQDGGEGRGRLGAGGTEVLRSRHFVDIFVVVRYGGASECEVVKDARNGE